MTREEAQVRNNKIMQFRGCATRVVGMIPEDILMQLSKTERQILLRTKGIFLKTIMIMNESRGCEHIYYGEDICHYCGHKKYSRDGLGKGTYNGNS